MELVSIVCVCPAPLLFVHGTQHTAVHTEHGTQHAEHSTLDIEHWRWTALHCIFQLEHNICVGDLNPADALCCINILAQMLVCCKKILEYWLHTSCMHAWVVAGAHKYGAGERPPSIGGGRIQMDR